MKHLPVSAFIAIACCQFCSCDHAPPLPRTASDAKFASVPFELLGPIRPAAGYWLDIASVNSIEIAGARTSHGRVVAVAAPLLSPGTVNEEHMEVAVKRLDDSAAWRFIDPDADSRLDYNTGPFLHQVATASTEPAGLLRLQLDELRWRTLFDTLELGEVGQLPRPIDEEAFKELYGRREAFAMQQVFGLPSPFSACGGIPDIATVNHPPGTTSIEITVAGNKSQRPAVVGRIPVGRAQTDGMAPAPVQVVVGTEAALACCQGELFWVEVHPHANATKREFDAAVNFPMAVSVQGMKSGVVGVDVLPGLVGATDLEHFSKLALGCMGPMPIVAAMVDNFQHEASLWISIPAGTRQLPPQQSHSPATSSAQPVCSATSPIPTGSATAPPAASAPKK